MSDFQKLVEEAVTEVYNPRAKRCWLLFHQWTMWEADPTNREQSRRCLRCGKMRIKSLRSDCLHVWHTYQRVPLVNQEQANIGQICRMECKVCGIPWSRTLYN